MRTRNKTSGSSQNPPPFPAGGRGRGTQATQNASDNKLSLITTDPVTTDPITTDVKLFCLVHGDDPTNQAFKVDVANVADIADLKKLIKKENSPELDSIAARNLTLWLVNIRKSDLDTLGRSFHIESYGHKLSPFDEIQDTFPEGPARNHLHIVVELPPVLKRSPSPTLQHMTASTAVPQANRLDPYEVIDILFHDPKTTAQLESLKLPNITRYVRDHQLLKNDIIPIGPDGYADMRFYRKKLRGERAQEDFEKLKEMIGCTEVTTKKIAALLGVSGCGKTATVFEIGSEDFVTFFVIPRQFSKDNDINGLDTRVMLDRVEVIMKKQEHRDHNIFSSHQDAIDALKELQLLEKEVLRCIQTLLVARRISWSLLRRYFDDRLTPLTWLYCQEMMTFGSFFAYIFRCMMNYNLGSHDLEHFEHTAHQLFINVTKGSQRFAVAIDECHRLTRYHRNTFLPRTAQFLHENGTLTEDGRQFVEHHLAHNPFDVTKPSTQSCPTWSYRSIFPLVVEGFKDMGAATLMILGTNLELSNLVELDSMVGKYKELFEIEEITEFHTFTPDDVIFMLRECLNQQGVPLTAIKELANNMEGRARFTMGFLEYVAKAKIMPGENQKRVALERLKAAHEHIIVKSSSPIGLQKHIGSLISDPQTPVSTPQRAGTQVVAKQIIDAPKFLQDILMASIFSRGQMLYNSADAIKFVRHGLCHLTRSETPWLDDVCESDEVQDDVTDIQEIVEELSIEDREALDTSNNIDEEDRQSNTSISPEPDVAVAARPEFWCTLAEPWVRYALIYFFSQRLATDAIYSEYLTGLMTSPALTPAARGSLLEWTIMTKIKQNWTSKSLRGILKDSGLLPKHKILPRWLNDSLEVQPFDKILDESTVSAADDTLECFLSGVHGRVALLPTALAGPDGICATSTKGVFVVFASALSTKHDIEGKKCRKNIKTTDIENFYTKSDGRPYKLPESINSQFYSLRGRHDRIQSLQRRDGAIKGLLRIHFNIPKASGKIELYEVVEKGCRTDVIINVDLKSAQDLHLLDGKIGNVLHALCKI